MATPNRAALLTKLHKSLKKHYKAVGTPTDRPLLDHLLYACCLENSSQDAADEAFARLQQRFFDWNEVRVSTLGELAANMTGLHNPQFQANNLKRCLQSVFETHYAFDLEPLKKQNLGKSEKQIEKYAGVSRFILAYVVQHGLGGHSIPVDQATIDLAVALEVITPAEAEKGIIPGLERAIPKNKGKEFAELLHHLAVDAANSPGATRVKTTLNEVDPDARGRLAKRKAQQQAASAPPPPAPKSPPPAAPAKSVAPPAKSPSAKTSSPASAKSPPARADATAKKKPAASAAKPSEAKAKPAAAKRPEPSKSSGRAEIKRLAKKKPR